MENEEKLVIFDKYPNALDANIIKGAIEASGIPASVLTDSTANAMWMAPVPVVVFGRDLEAAIRAVYQGEKNYEDYRDEMDLAAFENMQACNMAFGELALKIHPEIGGKQYRDLYAQAKDALEAGNLKTLTAMNEQIPAPVAALANETNETNATNEVSLGEPKRIRGWLLLYLVLAVIIDVAAVALMVYVLLSGSFSAAMSKSMDVIEMSLTVFLILAACVMTVLVIRAFKDRRPDAVFLGRHSAIINVVPIAYLGAWSVNANCGICDAVATILFFTTLGYRFFFNKSSLVKALIPPASRKVSSREKYLVTFWYAVLGVSFCIHSGFDRWWWIVCGLWGLLCLSPLMDEPSDLGNPEKED